MHFRESAPICPHCNHALTNDEMLGISSVDLFALAPNEGTAEIECPACDKMFCIQGGYTPYFTTAGSEEELC